MLLFIYIFGYIESFLSYITLCSAHLVVLYCVVVFETIEETQPYTTVCAVKVGCLVFEWAVRGVSRHGTFNVDTAHFHLVGGNQQSAFCEASVIWV